MTTFHDLDLSPALLSAVETQGYDLPTEIQTQTIPVILSGRDVLATAQTGTGKTAAFVLPLLHLLAAHPPKREARESDSAPAQNRGSNGTSRGANPVSYPRVLILAPTRELAVQIDERVAAYGAGQGIRNAVVYGGASKVNQQRELRRFPQVLTATPGRLMDFIGEKQISLARVEYLVLDEADRMLDMGFIPDVRRIVGMIEGHAQTAMFSATMPKEIADLAAGILRQPTFLESTAGGMSAENILQTVMFVEQANKLDLLTEVIDREQMFRVIVFTRTKHRASRVAKALCKSGITADSIHGDKTQAQRTRALAGFRGGKTRVLVATDVAARGIDVDDISHVINFEIPAEAETYVHRIGRTARAGSEGAALSLCDGTELQSLRQIEKLIANRIAVDRDNRFHVEHAPPAQPKQRSGKPGQRGRSRGPAAHAQFSRQGRRR
ncbi:MAG: DEAD/DEAH box helicase [Spirochaetaceae bacterium]|nr:MAG: DEAD/DEAH box helicase [Spirochaetaceae bacterium]